MAVANDPLQCVCLENPRDGGAWWAAVYGITQSWTRLKWLSSSSSSSKRASRMWRLTPVGARPSPWVPVVHPLGLPASLTWEMAWQNKQTGKWWRHPAALNGFWLLWWILRTYMTLPPPPPGLSCLFLALGTVACYIWVFANTASRCLEGGKGTPAGREAAIWKGPWQLPSNHQTTQ